MSDFDDDDFKSDFQQGVEDATDKPIIYVDPDVFKGLDNDITKGEEIEIKDISPENISTMKDILEEGSSGITKNMSNSDIGHLVVNTINSGPAAKTITNKGEELCLVTGLDENIEAGDNLVKMLGGDDLKDTRVIETDRDDIKYFVGAHEGVHCDQDPIPTSMPADEKFKAQLEGEINSDRGAIALTEQNRRVNITEDITTLRNLDSASNPVHATNLNLDGAEPIKLSAEQAEAAATFPRVIDLAVMEELDISDKELIDLKISNGDKYNETIDKLIDEGAFSVGSNSPDNPDANIDANANPFVEEYIKAYRDEQIKQEQIKQEEVQVKIGEQTKVESQSALDAEQVAQTELNQQLEQKETNTIAASPVSAVNNVIAPTMSSTALAATVPFAVGGAAMVHGDDIADRSSIEVAGKSISGDAGVFEVSANENMAQDREIQAQQMQLSINNATAFDPNQGQPTMSTPVA